MTFPDNDSPTEDLHLELSPTLPMTAEHLNGHQLQLQGVHTGSMDTVKFEEKRMTSASKTKVVTDGFSSEQVNLELFFFNSKYFK